MTILDDHHRAAIDPFASRALTRIKSDRLAPLLSLLVPIGSLLTILAVSTATILTVRICGNADTVSA